MRVLVISNDVTPGFGVPVAAPGLRAAGIAEGLRSHGFEVAISVPSGVISGIFGDAAPHVPADTDVVDPRDLVAHIERGSFETVVFCNANMTPHLRPVPGVRFVYDLFAPKLLEALSSPPGPRSWQEMAREKERGLALADTIWVNGRRKLGYAVGWLVRPTVDEIRVREFGKPSIVDAKLLERICIVEMPVPLPGAGLNSPASPLTRSDRVPRVGIAGYAQRWSSLPSVHPAHQLLADAGVGLHALLPAHWGGRAEDAPPNHLPPQTVHHVGPLDYPAFARWIQSMDAMCDLFVPSPERTFAMITRSAVALRLGVPLLHGVDSEIADIVRDFDAGWVLDPDDLDAWQRASREVFDPAVLANKRAGAQRASEERFAPHAALAQAARSLRTQ